MDGSKIVDFGSNGGVMLNINPDMIEEVKIQTSNYSAEYGSPHVQVSAVTKGGSSKLHGSVYDYVRNWRWNANDRSNSYAGVPRPESTYQYPGFNLSGSIGLDALAAIFLVPTFALTPSQQSALAGYGGGDERAQRETIVGRIISGDPSAQDGPGGARLKSGTSPRNG